MDKLLSTILNKITMVIGVIVTQQKANADEHYLHEMLMVYKAVMFMSPHVRRQTPTAPLFFLVTLFMTKFCVLEPSHAIFAGGLPSLDA